MLQCPQCLQTPAWHYCRNVSVKHKVDHYLFTPSCRHSEQFQRVKGFVLGKDRAATESEWDKLAENIFVSYTASWTEIERTLFKARIWPAPELVFPKRAVTPEELEPMY